MNRSLILGLLALVILCVLCLWCRAPAIEDDLRGKALICVEDAGVDADVLAVSGRDVTLEGAVASLSVGDAIAEGVYGGVIFSPPEIARLEVIFPDGVCDYSQGDSRKP